MTSQWGIHAPLVALALLGCLAACGGAAPDLVAVGSEGISFSRPASWDEVRDLTRDGTLARQAWVSGRGEGGARTGLFVDVFCADDAETVVEAFVLQNRREIASFELVQRRRVEVPGAESATLLESTYGQRSGSDSTVGLTRLDEIAAADDVVVRLSIVGPSDALDRDTAQRVVDSLELSPSDELVRACREAAEAGVAPPPAVPAPDATASRSD